MPFDLLFRESRALLPAVSPCNREACARGQHEDGFAPYNTAELTAQHPLLLIRQQASAFLFHPPTAFLKGRGEHSLTFHPMLHRQRKHAPSFFVCGEASKGSLFISPLHSFLGRGAGEPFFGFLAPRCSAKAEARVSGSNSEIALPSASLRSALIRTVPPQFL